MIAKNSKLLLLGIATVAIWGVAGHRGSRAQSVSATNAQTGCHRGGYKRIPELAGRCPAREGAIPIHTPKDGQRRHICQKRHGRGPGGGDGRQRGPGRPGARWRDGRAAVRAWGLAAASSVSSTGKAVWSNFPVSDVPRPGLTLGSLSSAQRDAAMHLLQVVLSPKGYQKVLEIMGSDQALSDSGTPFSSGIDCLHARHVRKTERHHTLDVAVWRSSSRPEHHGRRGARRDHAHPDGSSTCHLHVQRQDGARARAGE